MAALAFGFTKLVVDDLEAVVRFYTQVFGMTERHRVSSDEHLYALDEAMLSLGESGPSLVIVKYKSRPTPPSGAAWTGFVVPDLAACLSDVERLGGAIEVPAHDNAEHRVTAAIAADPAGHLIEIVQMMGAP